VGRGQGLLGQCLQAPSLTLPRKRERGQTEFAALLQLYPRIAGTIRAGPACTLESPPFPAHPVDENRFSGTAQEKTL
jgi:hypothetical protein